ncbi:MAG TPA: DUF4915 domain-containing protein [Candidatus Elarobacter sp.]|jgi:acetolactate synthase-1/2/3 large subunit|nr:DUF4915 domain-containing protein [Candidatus Elarobacter sp.]
MLDVVCATTFGALSTGGGLFTIEGGRVENVDHTSSLGLATDGRRVARVLHSAPETGDTGEVLISDERGVSHYLRLDDAMDAHDVAWDGDEIVVVSPWKNAVQWYGLDGVRRREIRLPGPEESWHVNCVVRHDGRWYATVFGDFASFRGWAPPAYRGRGQLIDLETRGYVLGGVTAPHTPRFDEGMWFICDSGDGSVAIFDGETKRLVQRVPCGGWTRGLALTPSFAFVGVSSARMSTERRRAEVVMVDRTNWSIVERYAIPSQEVYDVTIVSQELARGLRSGFHSNPTRTAEAGRRDLLREIGVDDPSTLWPVGEAISEADSRCTISAAFPAECSVGELLEIPVSVTNLGSAFLSSAPPFPTSVSYRWLDARGHPIVQGRDMRSALPVSIPPGGTGTASVRIGVPRTEGAVTLTITLVQDGVRWFDEVRAENAVSGSILVRPPQRASLSDVPAN